MEINQIQAIQRLRSWASRNSEFSIIAILVAIYLFIGNYFAWQQAFVGLLANVSGGSDPYFNYYIIQNIIATGHLLTYTQALNYPIGSGNPRNPFFHELLVFMAEILSPVIGVKAAAYYAFMEFDAVFGALLIIPVYLLAKDVFGKKTGLLSAFIYTLIPSNLSSGILTDGRMHTPELIFAFFAIYFFEKAIRLSSKERIIGNFTQFKSYYGSVMKYVKNNILSTEYAIFAAISYGALMLSWQGAAYILAIIAIYIIIQLIFNLFASKNTGYITFVSVIFVLISFAMGYYYYYAANNAPSIWFIPPLYIGLGVIAISILIGILGRKPWIISIPLLIIVLGGLLIGIKFASPHIFNEIISGEGYFIKTRVYSTIAEAQSPLTAAPLLSSYLSEFGIGIFAMGMGGIIYMVYLVLREKKDSILFMLVFSLVSIYMSFAAARFNVTAAPAYAIGSAALLMYILELLKLNRGTDQSSRKTMKQRRSAIKADIKWLQVILAIVISLGLVLPAGLSMISNGIPANNAEQVNKQIYDSLPSFIRPYAFQANSTDYIGGTGLLITNSSSPFSASMKWFAQQDANVPINQKPAYVSWWDYGFQELYQGQHPTVADDFQQAYQVAGQILLATNQTQVISLFTARVLEANYISNNGQFSQNVKSDLIHYLGNSETKLITSIEENPSAFSPWIGQNQSVYGKFIQNIGPVNSYFALIKGQLSSKYTTGTIVNLYQALKKDTGYNIAYIQVDHSLFPFSGNNPGIFYAPAYLTETPSVATPTGEVIPTNYYNIQAVTANGTFNATSLPPNVQPTGYQITYTPTFYNTSIYRFMIGLPPSAVGQSNGIPGITFGQTRYSLQPAYNMSHFEIMYESIPFNPYKNYSAHPNAWKLISLQQAYEYQKEKIGTEIIFPPSYQITSSADPIVEYFPGAKLYGQVTSQSGIPISGAYVTVFDQYGIPHEYTRTNANGFYNLSAVPGNDSVFITSGTFLPQYLSGSNTIKIFSVNVSMSQAQRTDLSYNMTTGLPGYYIENNYKVNTTPVSGLVNLYYQKGYSSNSSADFISKRISSGTVQLYNSTYDVVFTAKIVNGQYSFSNIPSYSYAASVIVNGTTYNDIQTVNVTISTTPVIYDLNVKLDTIFASMHTGGIANKGYTITVSGSGFKESTVTNSSGEAAIYVLPGEYSVYSSENGIISSTQYVSFNALGQNISVNLSSQASFGVTVKVVGYHDFNQVSALNNGNLNESYALSNLGNGYFYGNLTIGTYTIYAKGNGYVILNTTNVNKSITITVFSESATTVKLIPNISNATVYSGEISILYQSGFLYENYNANGSYGITVPSGYTYGISGQAAYAGKIYANSVLKYISGKGLTQSINMINSTQLTALTYNKNIGPFSANSALKSGVSILYYDNMPLTLGRILSDGYSNMYIESSSLTGYSVRSYSVGFQSQNIQLSGTTINVGISPPAYNGSLQIFLNDGMFSKLNGSAKLVGTQNYTLQIKDGFANFSLVPGIYSVSIIGANQFVNLSNNIISITTQNENITLSGTSKVMITALGSKSTKLFNTNGTEFPGTNYVSPGEYTVYSISDQGGVNITFVSLYQNTSITPTFNKGFVLSLDNSLGDSGFYTISSGSTRITTSSPSILLDAGVYTVSFNKDLVNSSGSWQVSGSTVLSLSGNMLINITVSSKLFLTDIHGFISYSGVNSSLSTISLYRNGEIAYISHSNTEGQYSLQAKNGTYTIYAYNNQTNSAYVGSIGISPFETRALLNISLNQAFNVKFAISMGTSIINTSVNISLSNYLIIVNSYGTNILLPQGNFTFSAQTNSSIKASNYSESVSYSNSTVFDITSSTIVQLTLEKLYVYNLTINYGKVKNITAGSNFTYNLSIKNRGNSIVNVTLGSGSSAWNITFKTKKIELDPNETVNVSATFQNASLVPMGNNSIPITLNYHTGTITDYVNVNISRFYDLKISSVYNNYIVFDSGYGSIPIKLINKGNTNETVKLQLQNVASIQLYNWNASITFNGKTVTQVNLSFNQSVTVYIKLVPISNVHTTSQLTIGLNGTVNGTKYTMPTLTASFPSVPGLLAYPTGTNLIANYTGNPNSTLISGSIILVIVVVVGVASTAIASRRKRK
ncbi:MAG: carboxypeptidase regulatory-like domain-containing protein [Thermoplasmataceae archaeon]